jgi:hypothetical protein
MIKTTGRFYLKQTSNRNLIGEFSNRQNDNIFTESADLKSENANENYIGKYNSTWQENGTAYFKVLEIMHKPNTNNKIFTLKWRGERDESGFDGEGMLCDDILIGDYHSV